MPKYNDKLILGETSFDLDNTQRDFLQFEENTLRQKFATYLEIAESEEAMHYFFEINPAFLPGLYDRHNGPLGEVVISKLKLGTEFITDFAFISVNSAEAQITLIEIESPVAPIFRKSDDHFSSNFNKAYQQVRDWRTWAEQNFTYLKDTFRALYHSRIFRYRKVTIRGILIAGRRSEVQENPQREKRWGGVNHDPYISVMSYDRLIDGFYLNPTMLKLLSCHPARQISHILKKRQ